jgi:FAD:protein FMN transferase
VSPSLTRRRFLCIAAGGAVIAGSADATTVWWRGTALGAQATIRLGGIGRAEPATTIAAIRAELDRLEQVFSLYRADSAVSALNREGILAHPPPDLVAVLQLCDALNRATGGAFDPTVQPLWLAQAGGDAAARRSARGQVGWAGLEITRDRLAFGRPGMAITLNGVAQGYVTDRIAALLRARGYGDILVDMGEIAGFGRNAGVPWQAGIARPDGVIVARVTLRGRALATSAPMATMLDRDRRVGHILDPRAGRSGPRQDLVSVSAATAAVADGLSTGCCLLSAPQAAEAVAGFQGARIEVLA